jgi:hypothetical protein
VVLLVALSSGLRYVLPRRWLRAARKLDPVDTTTPVDTGLDLGYSLAHGYNSSR